MFSDYLYSPLEEGSLNEQELAEGLDVWIAGVERVALVVLAPPRRFLKQDDIGLVLREEWLEALPAVLPPVEADDTDGLGVRSGLEVIAPKTPAETDKRGWEQYRQSDQ